jgi:hypothetical protein
MRERRVCGEEEGGYGGGGGGRRASSATKRWPSGPYQKTQKKIIILLFLFLFIFKTLNNKILIFLK